MDDAMPFSNEAEIMNFKMNDGSPSPMYVQDYINQSAIELYAAPISDGNITFQPDASKDIIIKEDELFVAITLTQFENSGIDLPLCVTKVTQDHWKKSQ